MLLNYLNLALVDEKLISSGRSVCCIYLRVASVYPCSLVLTPIVRQRAHSHMHTHAHAPEVSVVMDSRPDVL